MKHKNIPKGYKDSPLGIIPKEWEVKRLGEISEISSGGTPLREKTEYWNGDIPWITTSLINQPIINKADEFITELGLYNSAAKIIKEGTLLMAMYGQGMTRGKVSKLNISAATNQACAAIQIKENYTDYIFYTLDYLYYDIRSLSNDGGQKNLSLELIKNIKISIPSIVEQKKIAELLSTWDEAIEKQTKLIDILSRRKRALMQQLLTEKKRLPNFTKKWKKVKLGEISTIKKGKALTESEIADGIYPVIAGGKTSPYNHNNFTDENVVTISASGAYAGFVSYHNYKIWASDCSVIKSINKVSNIHYLYQLLSFHQNYIYTLQSGGAQPHIFPKDISKLSFYIPTVDEQEIIAKILSNNDHLISLARKRLDMMLIQKRGLMQQLLTGKKRIKT